MNQSLPQPGIELDVVHLPNPFFGVASSTFIDSTEEDLILVDGGEDGEVIPLQPLMVKARGVDVIIAIDAVSNTQSYGLQI
jgi:lysophospholipase